MSWPGLGFVDSDLISPAMERKAAEFGCIKSNLTPPPIHTFFSDSNLYGTGGSAEATIPAVREKVLADGIPALSNAAGATYLSILGQDNKRDMSGTAFIS